MKLFVPLEIFPLYDDQNWNKVADAARKVKISVVIGGKEKGTVDSTPNANYERAVRKLKSSGAEILGYVTTNNGNREITNIKSDIRKYFKWDEQIRVHGIYLMGSNSLQNTSYFSEIYQFVKQNFGQNKKLVISNGQNIKEFVSITDAAVVFDDTDFSKYKKSGSFKSGSIAIIRNFRKSENMKTVINEAKASNIEYIYVTNKNNFESLPTYFDEEVTYLESLQTKIQKLNF